MLQDYEMLVTSNSLNLIKELRLYQWNDKKANTPIDNYNHLIDGMRYLATEKLSNRSDTGTIHLAERW